VTAHFHVELVKLSGRTIGARILVAKTWRDLEIAIEAQHHDELLELLRRLRRVVFRDVCATAPDSRAHLPATTPSDRRRIRRSLAPSFGGGWNHDLAALHDVAVQPVAAQIEEAVAQPDISG
jgi:hypothetical protein